MFAQQLVNGLMLGSVYALIGIGYTLVFGVLRMLNLAHAYIFMAGPCITLGMVEAGVPAWLALCLGLAGAALLGVLLYLVAFKPIPREHALGGFVASLAFGIVLQVIAVNKWGSLNKPFPASLPLPDLNIGPIILSGMQLGSLAISAVMMLGLLYLIRSTRFGRNIRAIALNPTAASLLGVAVPRAVLLVFLLSSGLAGLGGGSGADRDMVDHADMGGNPTDLRSGIGGRARRGDGGIAGGGGAPGGGLWFLHVPVPVSCPNGSPLRLQKGPGRVGILRSLISAG